MMTNQEVQLMVYSAEKAAKKKDLPGVLAAAYHILMALTYLPRWVRWGIPGKWMKAIRAVIEAIESENLVEKDPKRDTFNPFL